MANEDASSLQTRPSLLHRLKSGDDMQSWQEFYRIYGRVVRDFAVQAGLNGTEADEVVQETAIAISRHIGEYCYDRRFKTWLRTEASCRVKDQFRKRNGRMPVAQNQTRRLAFDEPSFNNRVLDSLMTSLDVLFELEWRKNHYTMIKAKTRRIGKPSGS